MFDKKYKLKRDKHGSVKRIPSDWIRMPTEVTSRYEKRGIPVYSAIVGYQKLKNGRGIPVTKKYTHKDFETKVRHIHDESRAKDEECIRRAKNDPQIVAEALSSIWSEASKQLDIQNKSAKEMNVNAPRRNSFGAPGKSVYKRHNDAKKIKDRLYRLKDEALQVLLTEWDGKPVQTHDAPGGRAMDIIKIGEYEFHIARRKNGKCHGRKSRIQKCGLGGGMDSVLAETIIRQYIRRNNSKEIEATKRQGGFS